MLRSVFIRTHCDSERRRERAKGCGGAGWKYETLCKIVFFVCFMKQNQCHHLTKVSYLHPPLFRFDMEQAAIGGFLTQMAWTLIINVEQI